MLMLASVNMHQHSHKVFHIHNALELNIQLFCWFRIFCSLSQEPVKKESLDSIPLILLLPFIFKYNFINLLVIMSAFTMELHLYIGPRERAIWDQTFEYHSFFHFVFFLPIFNLNKSFNQFLMFELEWRESAVRTFVIHFVHMSQTK